MECITQHVGFIFERLFTFYCSVLQYHNCPALTKIDFKGPRQWTLTCPPLLVWWARMNSVVIVYKSSMTAGIRPILPTAVFQWFRCCVEKQVSMFGPNCSQHVWMNLKCTHMPWFQCMLRTLKVVNNHLEPSNSMCLIAKFIKLLEGLVIFIMFIVLV